MDKSLSDIVSEEIAAEKEKQFNQDDENLAKTESFLEAKFKAVQGNHDEVIKDAQQNNSLNFGIDSDIADNITVETIRQSSSYVQMREYLKENGIATQDNPTIRSHEDGTKVLSIPASNPKL